MPMCSPQLLSTKMTNILAGKVTLDQASCPPICLLIRGDELHTSVMGEPHTHLGQKAAASRL